jgi:hypothetical protein
VQLPRDIPEIGQVVERIGDVGLALIDPVSNHIAGKDSNQDDDIRAAIAPFNAFADEHACMVIGVRNLTEKEVKGGVLAAILGSSAWVQVPRVVVAMARDNNDAGLFHMQVVAGNRVPLDVPGRMFRIEGVMLPDFEEPVTRANFVGDSTRDLDTLLSAKKPSKSGGARELILHILRAEGQQPSEQLDRRVAAETRLSPRTIKNLRRQLADQGLIESVEEKDAAGHIARWLVTLT